jgi:uncharacterized protein (TIRG00374 family)
MNRKRILITLAVFAILCLLVYLQVRTWSSWDWATFRKQTEHVNWWYIASGIVLTYAAYALRALRWRIFLKPARKTTSARLMAPQFIGFTALALLGRAGEVVRPYIIAKKENLTFSSQMGVWTVERICDMGAFAVILAVSFLSPELRSLKHYWLYLGGGALFIALVLGLLIFAVVIRKWPDRVGDFCYRQFTRFAPGFAQSLREKIHLFSVGLNTMEDLSSAIQIAGVSLLMWLIVMFAYRSVMSAYPDPVHSLSLAKIILLMLASMAGSLLQLPGVGGGSQLATIKVLTDFGVGYELSVSCGLVLWAVTFMSVTPAGLLLARREHVSLRAVEEAEEKAAALAQ